MYRYIRALILVGSLLAASHVEAAIVINEVAWMGSDIENGSSCEWIELYNPDLAAVNLSGWSLKIANAGSGAPKTITLSELEGVATTVVQPGGFYLLARNSGACLEHAPGNTADWSGSFGTGISNTGSKLTLSDSAGILMDTVDAEDGWDEIGGYNATGKAKLTPQRNGTSWVTAAPTPKAVNATETEETSSPTTSSTNSSTSSTKKVALPKIYVEAGEDRIVSTNAHTDYRAFIYTDTGRVMPTARAFWSYGEGSADRAQAGYHAYSEPGEYVVKVRGEYGWKSAEDSFIVTVDSAQIRVSEVLEKGIRLENFDDRMLDLSYWKLKAGATEFKIPQGTWILPGRSVLFPAEVTGLPYSPDTSLLYPSGKTMNEYVPATSTLSGE